MRRACRAGTRPDSIGFGFEDVENRILESYSFDYKGQRFARSVIYRSVHYPVLDNKPEEANASDLLKQLTTLPPEAVLKRGREQKHGREVVKFEVIDLAKLKLSTMFGVTSANIFVDVQSRLPIAIEGVGIGGHVSRIWAIEINQSATSIFDLPPLPADVDAEENWTFWLPVGLWERDSGFTIRVSGPDGDPVISESDFRSMGPYRGGGFESELLSEGIEKLDRFMARHPGASVKIEIAGEPPIQRKVFGRLSRQIGVAPVRLIGFGPVECGEK